MAVSWENKVTTDESELDALGADGWELVAVVTLARGGEVLTRHYLKRKVDGRRRPAGKAVTDGA
jgi:hypothetical protein